MKSYDFAKTAIVGLPLLRESVDRGGFLRFLREWIFHRYIAVMDSVIGINLKASCPDFVLRKLLKHFGMKFEYSLTV